MTRRRRDARIEGIYDPNMTPLIDVSLVLVVILMVATPLAFQSSLAVRAASSSGRAAAVNERADRIEIRIHGDGTVEIDRARVERAAMAGVLQPLLAGSASRLVVVRCDDQVPHGEFVSVLDQAKALGARQIAIVGS
jgi:biopolymer transport protein ExbD